VNNLLLRVSMVSSLNFRRLGKIFANRFVILPKNQNKSSGCSFYNYTIVDSKWVSL